MRKRKVLFSYTAILCFTISGLFASPADPTPRVIIMPDGTEVTLVIKGDEKVRWAETVDGYTVLSSQDGFYKYAYRSVNGDLSISDQRANDPEKRNHDENVFLSNIDTNLLYSKSQVLTLKTIWDIKRKEASKGFPTTGKRDLIMILIGFSDTEFSKSHSDFNILMNQTGYSVNGATGSVKDYFSDNSFEQLTLNTIVVGPYVASENMAYYGDENGDARELVSEAIDLADADVDFSKADNDSDGNVDGIYIIYAGYGEEAGGGDAAIWAHAWSLASSVEKDGVAISRYSCSPELSGNSGSTITNIGIICHEFSHVCGLPDYYDTDYEESGGQSFDLGGWDCMAGGSWNNDGKTPPFHNAYSRNALGWQTTTLLDATKDVELLNSAENNVSYKFLSNTVDEYFMVENRQKINWDAYVPHHGMLIYHVDLNYSGWLSNDINNVPDHQGMDIEEADGIQSKGSTSGDPFPGTSSKTSFTDATIPSSLSWDGVATNKPITNIVEDDAGKITFHIDFGGGSAGTELLIVNFEDNEDLSGWKVLNGNADDSKWQILSKGGINDTKCGGYHYSDTEIADDWLFSRAIDLVAGVEYEANFYYAVGDSYYPEKLSLYYGNDNTGAMSNLIIDLGAIANQTFTKSTNDIVVSASGTYYFGWHCYSDAGMFEVYVDSIVVREKTAIALEGMFTADVTSGEIPLTVKFTDQSTASPTSWSWDFNNDGIEDSDVQNPSYTFTEIGVYTISLDVSNAQTSDAVTKTEYISVNAVGIISHRDIRTWQLHPNPASSQVTISFLKEQHSNVTVEIYSTNGQKFYAKSFTSIQKDSEVLIDLSVFENGVYFVKVLYDETCSLEKLIIQ